MPTSFVTWTSQLGHLCEWMLTLPREWLIFHRNVILFMLNIKKVVWLAVNDKTGLKPRTNACQIHDAISNDCEYSAIFRLIWLEHIQPVSHCKTPKPQLGLLWNGSAWAHVCLDQGDGRCYNFVIPPTENFPENRQQGQFMRPYLSDLPKICLNLQQMYFKCKDHIDFRQEKQNTNSR